MRAERHCGERRANSQRQIVAVSDHPTIGLLSTHARDELITFILIKLGIDYLNIVSTTYQYEKKSKRHAPNQDKPGFILL